MKKVIALILAFLLIPCVLVSCDIGSNENNEPTEAPVEELSFDLNDDGKGYTLDSIGTFTGTEIIVPETYKGLPVTKVGGYALRNKTHITKVVLPDTVKYIGTNAFVNCSSLKSITLGAELKEISSNVFTGCKALTEVYFAGTMEQWCNIHIIGGNSNPTFFSESLKMKNEEGEYEELTSIVIPDGITEIKENLFYNLTSVTSVVFPEDLQTIGDHAFSGCSGINTLVTIPATVTHIGVGAFSGCTSLTEVEFMNVKDWLLATSSADKGGALLKDNISDNVSAAKVLTETRSVNYWNKASRSN